MLNRFEARGYRNLDTAVTLGRCTVLVGPNNCGKSNLMRAIGFTADGARADGRWTEVIEDHGGAQLVSRDLDFRIGRRKLSLHWEGTAPFLDSWSHHLELGSAGIVPVVKEEVIDGIGIIGPMQATKKEGRYEAVVAGKRQDLGASSPWSLHDGFHDGVDYVASWRHVAMAALAPPIVARPWVGDPRATQLLPDASNLAAHLKHLENEHKVGLLPVTRAMSELMPSLQRIWVRSPEGAGATWLEFVDGGETRALREMSDGTVVALLLATLLHGPQRSGLLLLDEPELNLHPAWLRVIARWLRAPTAADQVIFSTHSTDLLDALTEGYRAGEVEVLVADRKAGFVNLERKTMEPFFAQGYELGDLYRVGEPAFGGWPW